MEPVTPFLNQRKFCEHAGISKEFCRQLRELGYIPYCGKKNLYIPVQKGIEGIERYTEDFLEGRAGK